MKTFLLERTIPPAFRYEDPAVLAEHSRWAVDAYRKVGAMWLGGVITDQGMFSLEEPQHHRGPGEAAHGAGHGRPVPRGA
jgi:hypothetical protein